MLDCTTILMLLTLAVILAAYCVFLIGYSLILEVIGDKINILWAWATFILIATATTILFLASPWGICNG